MGISTLVVAVFCFDSPIAIAMTGAITTVISCFINAFPNKKLIGYSYFEQMKDLLPSILASLAMLCAVLAIGLLPLAPIFILIIQIVVGVITYALISVVFKMRGFTMLLGALKSLVKKGKKNETVKESASDISSEG